MSEVVAQMPNILKGLSLGATGAGLVGNILNERQRSQEINKIRGFENLSPQQLAAKVASATGPLDRSLVQAVTGNVNANLAEQGLSEAPGLIATATSQALAPYKQADIDRAMQLVFRQLGLPSEILQSLPGNTNLSQGIAQLMQMFAKNPSSGGGSTVNWPGTPPILPGLDTTGSYDFGGLTPP